MAWVTVDYRIPNPEWERLADLLSAVRVPTDTLAHALDKVCWNWGGALCSPDGDVVGTELVGWRQASSRAGESAIEELQAAVAAVPETVTISRWQYVSGVE